MEVKAKSYLHGLEDLFLDESDQKKSTDIDWKKDIFSMDPLKRLVVWYLEIWNNSFSKSIPKSLLQCCGNNLKTKARIEEIEETRSAAKSTTNQQQKKKLSAIPAMDVFGSSEFCREIQKNDVYAIIEKEKSYAILYASKTCLKTYISMLPSKTTTASKSWL